MFFIVFAHFLIFVAHLLKFIHVVNNDTTMHSVHICTVNPDQVLYSVHILTECAHSVTGARNKIHGK